ncbi:MAG TPA: RDD family protein [Longimicrobium sp.]|nr:RDD family protein [Longimicrobium sp.]
MLRSNASYVITPDSFQVSPAITGLPLARPSRRLVAMLLDLFFVALLVELAGGVVLGLAAAYFAFRLASRVTGTGTTRAGKALRLAVRGVGAVILFVVALNLWGDARRAVRRISSQGVQMSIGSGDGGDSVRVSPAQALGLLNEVRALENATSEEEAQRLAGELAAGFRRAGMDEEQVRGTMQDIAEDAEQEWMGRAVQRALDAPAAGDSVRTMTPDSLARAYAAALAAGDTATAEALRPRLASAMARDSLDELRHQLRATREQNQRLSDRAERAENRGFLSSLTRFMDELGLGFGWTGLYFTAFLTLWRGQTPGKRITGVRVVRLNGQPMTLWTSFERFGGYAAGLVTGLLGFAQVYWDRNRQMIHDKIVETVVVREKGARAPAPAPAAPPAPAFAPYPSLRRPAPPPPAE